MPDFPDFIEGLVPGLDACYIEREVKSRRFHPDILLDATLWLIVFQFILNPSSHPITGGKGYTKFRVIIKYRKETL
jgi:hypothetical protein